MGVEILSETNPVARKEHDCLACDWLNKSGYANEADLTPSEWQAYQLAESDCFKIKKGDIYVRQNNKFDGEVYTFKAIPAIHDICIKYDLYEV